MSSANSRLGRYVLDVALGKGTFGGVWRAGRHASGEPVGVECLTGDGLAVTMTMVAADGG